MVNMIYSKNADSKLKFKRLIQHRPSPPTYYGLEWNRTTNINLARLRCGNPNLNMNLYLRNMADIPTCDCGVADETIPHFLLHCTRYDQGRRDVKRELPNDIWYTDVILHGSEQRYVTGENSRLNKIVQHFIEATNCL